MKKGGKAMATEKPTVPLWESLRAGLPRLADMLPLDWDRNLDDLVQSLLRRCRHGYTSVAEQEYTITIDIPGVDPAQVSVEVTGDRVKVKGPMGDEKSGYSCNHEISEISYGHLADCACVRRNLSETFLIPKDFNPDSATASSKHGVLTITFRKKDAALLEPKTIKVEAR